MNRFLIIVLFTLSFGNINAGSNTIPTPKDSRIRVIPYDPNDVVQLLGHYRYTMTIEYSPREVIMDINVGDTLAWQATPLGNRLVLKPLLDDATTNLTILTNFRSYIYELRAKKTTNSRSKDLTFYLRYRYPNTESKLAMMRYKKNNQAKNNAQLRKDNDKVLATKLYFGYSFQGDTTIAPIQVFDDGRFTYFKFREKSALPGIFAVDGERNESIVNFRIKNAYVVVEQLASRFTLRHGKTQTVTVLRDAIPGFEIVDSSTSNGVAQDKNAGSNSSGDSYADW